jgi:hypothetical protein
MYDLIAHLLDAMNAFVGLKLDKEIYIEVPKGLPKSLQPLYGLRQSANLWNNKVSDFVTSIGLRASTADSSIFIKDCLLQPAASAIWDVVSCSPLLIISQIS